MSKLNIIICTVAGLNKYMTSIVIFLVCIAYSSIGGLKAVLWSDAFQAFVMFATMLTVLILGISKVGGMGVVWERAEETGRTNVLLWVIFIICTDLCMHTYSTWKCTCVDWKFSYRFDPDPRTRHTFWTGTIAAFFSWIPLFAGTQAQIQRYLSVPTIRDARK